MSTLEPANTRRWPSCFVTGTDTGVGKTLVASAIVHLMARQGLRCAGMKPVAAGAQWRDGAWRNEDVQMLAAAGNVALPEAARCPYMLERAVAPHIAAQLAGVRIELPAILRAYQDLRRQCDAVVVEGVGGFRVPLGADLDTAELARHFGLPIVLVVGVRLGCLNHAALTAEAIAARGLPLLGWVANAIDPQMDERERNFRALQEVLPAPCLGSLSWMAQPHFAQVADRLTQPGAGAKATAPPAIRL